MSATVWQPPGTYTESPAPDYCEALREQVRPALPETAELGHVTRFNGDARFTLDISYYILDTDELADQLAAMAAKLRK